MRQSICAARGEVARILSVLLNDQFRGAEDVWIV